MDFHTYDFKEPIKIDPVPENENYGIDWPSGMGAKTPQLVKELHCLRLSREHHNFPHVRSTFHHMMNVIRMIWGHYVDIYGKIEAEISADGKDHVIVNTYFLNVIAFLCRNKSCSLTGPASASKTYGAGVYMLSSYYSAPSETMCMISTTSGTASEGRIWGDVKDLHRNANFEKHGIAKKDMGRIIDYLKCLTFDPDIPFNTTDQFMRDASNRDLRNGVQVIPIANDSKGEQALNTIMGRKNSYVLWAIDELPAMMRGVLRPRNNLEGNPFCQIIGIGNANLTSDPHGESCTPVGGWSNPAVTSTGTKCWEGKTMDVLYLDGDESPNDHPLINQEKVIDKFKYPFPYLSNKITRDAVAKNAGGGDRERGKLTLDYLRFAKGFWYGNSAENTIVSDEYVQSYNADDSPIPFTYQGFHTYASLDCGWAAGGDENSATFIKCGIATNGKPQIEVEESSIVISPVVTGEDGRDEYRKLVAREFVRLCKQRNVLPQNAAIDISGDGGLMYKAITEEWKMTGVIGLSSLEPSQNPKYANKVTEYWFSVREIIASGYVRGYNTEANYAMDLKSRFFTSEGRGTSKVEKKKDMKKRIHRSPDHGDSFSYCAYLVKTKFGAMKRMAKDKSPIIKENGVSFDFMTGAISETKLAGAFTRDRSYSSKF